MKNDMKMKRILLIVLPILMFLTSCEEFLEEEQVATLSYGYYETEQGCEALVNACYEGLRIKVGNEWAYGMFDYGTDEYMKGYEWTQPYAMGECNDYTPDLNGEDQGPGTFQADVGDVWNLTYNAIDRCNVAVDKIAKVEGGVGMLKDQEGKDIRTAEVRFLRAYHYFLLVQQWGALPLTFEPSSGLEYEWPRHPVSEVYEKIIEDLQWAYDHIPETQDDYGRVTKDAVRHYWAKVLLTRASYVADSEDDPDNYDPGGDPTTDLQKAAQLIDEIIEGGRHSLVPDYAELWSEEYTIEYGAGSVANDEIIFSIQFNTDINLNGTDGSAYKNQLHEFWFNQYDRTNLVGMARDVQYGRPFRRLFMTDYAIDIHDRLNDSRLRKSLLEVYYSTEVDQSKAPVWTQEELSFAFEDIAPDSSWAIRYGDTVYAGDSKFQVGYLDADGNVVVGDTALVFLLNDENTTLTDRQMVAAGYWIFPRYYWSTYADGSLNELITFDRDNENLETSNRPVVGSSTITTACWNRNFSPSLIKYWDRLKPDGFNSHVGTRDVFLARLAETYLIGAEIYGRLGDYNKAAEYINVVRTRAAYQDGEDKGPFWAKYDGGTLGDENSTVANMLINAGYWDDASHDEQELYPAGVSTKEERFIHFILNERCREMLGEMVRWEDLKRTGTLLERTLTYNDDTRNAAAMQKYHRLRPIPNAHLNSIKSNGNNLSPEEKQAYQNKGYY